MPGTYEPIVTTTLSTSASNILLSGIPSTYTDLKVVVAAYSTGSPSIYLRLNGDTTMGNYGTQVYYGDGATAYGNGFQSNSQIFVAGWSVGINGQPGLGIADIFSYTSNQYKSILCKDSLDFNGSGETGFSVNVWRSTAVVTSVTLAGGLYDAGTTITVFGIKAA